MQNSYSTTRSAIKRSRAENYLLISLTTLAASVIGTRLFLQFTGYPQLGNNILHIAHALWGGLILMISVLFPLIFANRWALGWSAALNGLGIGLFIDEVGKFITQNNDYFYPPAAPLIYAFFLLLVLCYLFVQRFGKTDARAELYCILSELRELADNNLDTEELQLILSRLQVSKTSQMPHISGLAAAIESYLTSSQIPLVPPSPGLDKKLNAWFQQVGDRIGRPRLRLLIIIGMILMAFEVLLSLGILIYIPFSPTISISEFFPIIISRAVGLIAASEFWFYLRIVLEILIGGLTLSSAFLIICGREIEGIRVGLIGLLLSLTGLLLLSFYLDQFGALTMAIFQFPFLLLVLSYRRLFQSPLDAHQATPDIEISNSWSPG